MKFSNLAPALRAAGLTVVETPGWATRGYKGRDLAAVAGWAWHHTATNRRRFEGADAPTLQMCIDGRPDVAGPLCNIVLGRNGTVYLVAAGLANHAGKGITAGVPRDQGNYYLGGIEMESSGIAPWDWTPDQLRVAPHLGAALEQATLGHLPPDARLQISHQEYSSEGKIDPAGWPGGMDGLRASINLVLAGNPAPPPAAPAPAPEPAPVAPAPPAPATVPLSGRVWTVDPGDTLGKIAGYYGISVQLLATANGIANPDQISVGTVLKIPAAGNRAWDIDAGDTLGAIAAYYGISVASIAAANGIANPDRIAVGARLWIP